MTEKTSIAVHIRCRPQRQEEARGPKCLVVSKRYITIGDKKFGPFESVFDEHAAQRSVYDQSVKELVKGCFEGFNGTIFAYGQTGSGKTHSMMGSVSDEEEDGIIPRAAKDLFSMLAEKQQDSYNSVVANIRVCFTEIYNEDCKDLLHPDIPSSDIAIREDKDGRTFFTGAREEAVKDVASILYYLEQGNLNRSTANTLMNQTSSRSHAIFTISIELLETTSPKKPHISLPGSFIQAKLHLVDLAGSERAKKTGAVGGRLKESVGINQGLLALGKVIRALTSSPLITHVHVPYRESKLTRCPPFFYPSPNTTFLSQTIFCLIPLSLVSFTPPKFTYSSNFCVSNHPVPHPVPHSPSHPHQGFFRTQWEAIVAL